MQCVYKRKRFTVDDKKIQTLIGGLNVASALASAFTKGETSRGFDRAASIFSSVGNAHSSFKNGDILGGCDDIASGIRDAFWDSHLDDYDDDYSYESDLDRDYSRMSKASIRGLESQAKSIKRQIRAQEDRVRQLDRQIRDLEAKRPWKGSYYDGSKGIDRDSHSDALTSWERKLDALRDRRQDADDRLSELRTRLTEVESRISTLKSEAESSRLESSSDVSRSTDTSTSTQTSTQPVQQPQQNQPTQPTQPTQPVQQGLQSLGQFEYAPDGTTRAEDATPENILGKDAVTLTKDQQLALLKEAIPNLDVNQLEVCPSDKGPSFKSGNTYYRVVNDNNEVKVIQTQMSETKATTQVSKLNNPKSDYSKYRNDESGNLNLTQQKALENERNGQSANAPVQNQQPVQTQVQPQQPTQNQQQVQPQQPAQNQQQVQQAEQNQPQQQTPDSTQSSVSSELERSIAGKQKEVDAAYNQYMTHLKKKPSALAFSSRGKLDRVSRDRAKKAWEERKLQLQTKLRSLRKELDALKQKKKAEDIKNNPQLAEQQRKKEEQERLSQPTRDAFDVV